MTGSPSVGILEELEGEKIVVESMDFGIRSGYDFSNPPFLFLIKWE